MKSSRLQVVPAGVVIAVITAGIMLFLSVTPLHAVASVPRILVLNSYNMGYDWWEDEMTGMRTALSKVFPRIELYTEHLDTKKFHTKNHFPAEADLLESKYAARQLDVLIAMDNAALEFALRYRQRISPGTPLVFCGINNFESSMISGQTGLSGVAEFHDSAGTLALALQLHPDARDVIVIHDYTDTGLAIRRELEESVGRNPSARLHFMEEMPLEEAVKKLKGIPPGYLVLMLSYTVEKGGRTFSHSEAARLVSSASPVPVYSVYAAQLGNGVVGGRMLEGQVQGQKAAELAVQIISGTSADKLPVITGDLSRPMFDYQVLKKFNISLSKLPAGAVLINKPPSTFAISKTTVWTGSMFTLFCIIGLIASIVTIRKRRRLEEMLRIKIDQFQKSQEELQATEEMLRAQVDEYMLSQDELQATEEMLRVQLDVAEEISQKFRAVFEHSPITVALTGLPDGTFCDVNQSFLDMFGYSREEALGKTTIDLGVWLHDSDRNRYLQLLREHGYVHNFEAEMRRKDGEEFTVLFSGVLLEVAGKPCVLSTVMEITEQKRLQGQLLQTQKMDVVGQLAGGIAHDFNNMLAGIMAAAELLKRRLSNDEKKHKLVDTIIEATIRSADLTRELLTFSRKGPAVSKPVHVHEIIASVMSLLERTIDKQIQLSALLDGHDPVVMGDQTQLQNAFLNLGVNARDAMPHGGTLTYASRVKTVDTLTCQSLGVSLAPGLYLEISVSDTGIGMSKAVLEHIFEPFFTTKGVGKGTGLGLAAVYGTVKSHGGDITVQSQPGCGSSFNIFLPLSIEASSLQSVTCEAVTGSGGILLVDDEDMLRSVGRDLLEDLGYTVYLAENGEQALEVFEAHCDEIVLVMLDMIMPKMGGKETFLCLRERSPKIKVLFCSGFSREGTGDELLEAGGDGFIQKPYNRSELSSVIAEVLAR
jgi:PAS domain S-box-containing protein